MLSLVRPWSSMSRVASVSFTVVLIAWFCFASSATNGQVTDSAIPGPVIRTTVSSSTLDYELRGAVLTGTGTSELLVAARPKDRPAAPESLLSATVDESGRVLSENPLAGVSTEEMNLGSAIENGFALGNGTVLVPTLDKGLRMVQLERSNDSRRVEAGRIQNQTLLINRILPISDERFAVLGAVRNQPLILEINTEGKTISEYLPRVEGVMPINAFFEADKTAIVVGAQGLTPNTTVWVGRVSPTGEILASISFPGSPKDAARAADGNVAILVESRQAESSQVSMKMVGPNLKELWTRVLVNRQHVVPSFQLEPVSTGGFIVAGVKDRGLWISRVTSTGADVWTEVHEPQKSAELEIVNYVTLAARKDTFVAAYSAYVVVGREQRKVVRTIRFTVS
jgi:hypothetical protein